MEVVAPLLCSSAALVRACMSISHVALKHTVKLNLIILSKFWMNLATQMLSSAKEAVIYIHYVQEHAIISEIKAWIAVGGLAGKPNNWDCFVLKTKIFAV